VQFEINKKRDAELAKLRRLLEDVHMESEETAAILRKKHQEAIADYQDQLEQLAKARQKYAIDYIDSWKCQKYIVYGILSLLVVVLQFASSFHTPQYMAQKCIKHFVLTRYRLHFVIKCKGKANRVKDYYLKLRHREQQSTRELISCGGPWLCYSLFRIYFSLKVDIHHMK